MAIEILKISTVFFLTKSRLKPTLVSEIGLSHKGHKSFISITQWQQLLQQGIFPQVLWLPGPRLNIKTVLPRYWDSYVKDKTVARPSCLVHPGVRDKRRMSEIDLSQPRHETAFWWRHNGPVTSQWTDPIKRPNYPLELIGIYVHTSTHNKESLIQRCHRSTNVQLCLIF